MKDPLLIIGNKPYIGINLDETIDRFSTNCRLNLSLPNNNNGTKYNHLGVCSHLRDNLLPNTPGEAFIDKYKPHYQEKYLREYVDRWNSEAKFSFDSKFFVNPDMGSFHSYLERHGCPHRFEDQPRTGISLVLDQLIRGTHKIFVTNFSICNEERVSHYVREGQYESECHGSAESEINILRWLHENDKIDATLCLLEDKMPPTFKGNGLRASEEVVSLVNSVLGTCIVKD